MEEPSLRTVVVALLANAGIAAAKLVAALLTGSSAMLAEAFHASADTGNQVLLLIAQRRGSRPPDKRHPMGYGREAYFWALIASFGVFVTGALFSVRQGIKALLGPTHSTSFAAAYVVLVLAIALESVSLVRAYRQIRDEARTLSRDFFEHLDLSSDPISRAVFAEDATAVACSVIALVGIALHQVTGSPVPDAVAAIMIGIALGYVAWELGRHNRDFLIGQEVPVALRGRVERIITAQAGIRAVTELMVTFLGPHQVWVVARIEIDDKLSGAALKRLFGSTERALKRASSYITRVDLAPVGA
jgi:cation diffusion facilitator family transporter